jgi:hypothetical protein
VTRREAVQALIGLPAVTRISRVEVKATDVIVCECDECLSAEGGERILETLAAIWPNQKVVICVKGVRIKLMAQGLG